MTSKLSDAISAVEKLPPDQQNEIADAILLAVRRSEIDAALAVGEDSLKSSDAIPLDDVFSRYAPENFRYTV